jgi:hypothetical protein
MVTRPRSYTDAITRKPAKDLKTLGSNILSDIQMGLGFKEKTSDYQARTRRTRDRMAAERERKKASGGGDRKPAKKAAPQKTPEQIAKEKERAEGQERRKKFEQKRGKFVAKRRALLRNIMND